MADATRRDFGQPPRTMPSGSAGGVMDTAKDKAKDVADSAREMAGQVATRAGEMAGQAGAKVQEWAHTARERAGDLAGDAGEYISDAGESLTGFIRRYPIPAMLVGLGIGFLLARTMRSS